MLLVASSAKLMGQPFLRVTYPCYAFSSLLIRATNNLHLWIPIFHKDVFDFALDSKSIEPGGCEDSCDYLEYQWVSSAIDYTRYPGNYERGASVFIPNSKIFDPRGKGSVLGRLAEKAYAGHADMVQYFLNQVAWLNQEAGADGSTRTDIQLRSIAPTRQN
ncbi:hypothetical protein F4781DRAFT_407011 [Annulohypoxylon bovei var. microspora]|nr:hypothetical protein F4781DRAFT_407011 [Annulohypoxylon bovei var. microspora]